MEEEIKSLKHEIESLKKALEEMKLIKEKKKIHDDKGIEREELKKSIYSKMAEQFENVSDKDALTIEDKKSLKRILVDKKTLKEFESLKHTSQLKDIVLIPYSLPTKEQAKPFDWPLELVLVRHGQSEGNEAVARSFMGDESAYTPEFRKKHSSTYRLTSKGIEQAKIAGEWIKKNIGEKFDRYYTSEYVRAMETSALLNLPDSVWLTEIMLRERDKGLMDNKSHEEKKRMFSEELERRKRDAFFWAPPGGESLADVCIRVEHTFHTLRRDCSNQKVIIVCHGEVMRAFRIRLERLSQSRFHQLNTSSDPRDHIHNAQVLHYTRIHPVTGQVYPYFRFMRSTCPWSEENSYDSWMEFERPTFTVDELQEIVSMVPRYVDNKPEYHTEEEVDY